jgi:hypothetical protein
LHLKIDVHPVIDVISVWIPWLVCLCAMVDRDVINSFLLCFMYLDGLDFIFAGDRVVEMTSMFNVKEF